MPLDMLSSIKDARSSRAVNELFNVIKRAIPDNKEDKMAETGFVNAVSVESLRSDKVARCRESERELIIRNFPKVKNGYLVVPKVIED